jgi:hypothetical protein
MLLCVFSLKMGAHRTKLCHANSKSFVSPEMAHVNLYAPREVTRSGWAGGESDDAHAHYACASHFLFDMLRPVSRRLLAVSVNVTSG